MKQIGFSSFEVLYGHPPCLIKGIQGDRKEIGDLTLTQQIQALGSTLLKINDWVWERIPISLTTPTHSDKPGDAIWMKEWNVQQLKPHWRDTLVVVLSIPPAVKVAEIAPWIHHSQVKPVSLKWECIPVPNSPCKITLQNTCTLPQQDPSESSATSSQHDDSLALVTLEAD
jgi:hypothetical protein